MILTRGLCNHGTQLNGINLAPTALQHASDKSAVVFCGVSLRFVHFGVLLRRLCGSDGGFQTLFQIIEANGFVYPLLSLSAVAVGYC